MKLSTFHKYHGLGNDFVVVRADTLVEPAESARLICSRHRGVGADGLLVLSDVLSDGPDRADIRMKIYNRDGTRPEMCGNGIRCVARHLVEVDGVDSDELIIATDAGERRCQILEQTPAAWQVRVDMGPAELGSSTVTASAHGRDIDLVRVDLGNPHAVSFEAADDEAVDAVGQWLNDDHPAFPAGVNVEWVDIVGPQRLQVRVFERGVGRTMACGTGACAAARAAADAGLVDPSKTISVDLPGGRLGVDVGGESVWMTGPARAVFCGTLDSGWRHENTNNLST